MTAGKYKKKNVKNYFFASLKSLKKGVGLELDPDPLVRGTDPWIWIRSQMSRMPNAVLKKVKRNICLETVVPWQAAY